jgi:tetratricopeptide (TPR) repeat protein
VELLRTMQEQDDLVQDTDGAWIESPALEWGTLPARVEAVIRARIDRLDEELRDLLAVASVEGDQFTAQVVAEVQGCLDRELLHALSRELGAHHRIVREAGETQIEGRFLSRYQFGHVLFQSYLYRTLSPGERRLLHGEVGEALEGLYGAQAETIAVQLAHHYSEAGRPEKAAAYAHCAGDRAREAYANDEAIAHYQQVLALLDAPALQKSRDELRLAALRGLGQVYLGLGAIVEAEACFRAAIELGKKLRLAPRELVRLHWWLADALSWQSGYDDVMKIGEDGLKLLGVDLAAIHTYAPAKAIESVEVALMYTHIAYAQWMGSGRNLNKCWDIADRLAHIIPRLPYSPELRPTYVLLCEVCIRQKNAEQALKWMYLLEERANQDYDPRALGAAYLESAYTLNQSGDFKGALSLYKQGLEHFRRIGDVKHETLARREIGGVLLRTGAPPKALEYVLGGIEIAEASEFKAHFVASAYSLAGWIALCQGEWSQAEHAFHKSIQNWQELGRSDGVAWNIHNLGRMYAAKGNAGRARRRFEEALAIVSEDKLATDSCLLASILSGLEDVYEDPEAFGAFCRCFKEELGGFYDLAFGRWHLGSIDESVQFRVPLQHYPFAESLASDWVWEDPMGDCSFDVRNGLAIYAANGRDLWHINLTAPRWLRPAPAEDCFAVQTVCVSVSDDMPAIGGLLLWRDKENYLRLDVGTRGADEISFQGCMENEDLVIGRGRLQGSAPESEQGSASRGPAWLRMERKGDTVRALCSADGEKWHTAGSVDFPFEGEAEIQVGLHAIGSIDRSIYHGAYPDGTAIRFESFTMCGLED